MEEKTSCKNILFLKKYEKLVIQFSGSFTGTEREEQMILEQDKIVYCTVDTDWQRERESKEVVEQR